MSASSPIKHETLVRPCYCFHPGLCPTITKIYIRRLALICNCLQWERRVLYKKYQQRIKASGPSVSFVSSSGRSRWEFTSGETLRSSLSLSPSRPITAEWGGMNTNTFASGYGTIISYYIIIPDFKTVLYFLYVCHGHGRAPVSPVGFPSP